MGVASAIGGEGDRDGPPRTEQQHAGRTGRTRHVPRWLRRAAPWLAAAAAAALALATLAPPARATVIGGCTATGTSTSGGEVDLTTTAVWHLRTTDRIVLAGFAPTAQTDVTVSASAFGFGIPLASGSVDGGTSATSDPYDVATLANLGRVFRITGVSQGGAAGCEGEVIVVIDDVNPLLTGLGAGGVALGLVGLIALAWAIRDPISLVRRVLGLIGLAFIGAGGSLVLQQISNPTIGSLGAAGPGPGTSGMLGRSPYPESVAPFVDAVVSPTTLSLDPTFLAQAAILTVLILVLLPFPSQLFNSTLAENEGEIRTALRRMPIARRVLRPTSEQLPEPVPVAWWREPAIVGFLLIAGLLYGLLDPTFGLDQRSVGTYAGIVLALVVVAWASDLPRRSLHARLAGDRGRLWVIPASLLVGAACVLISRLVGYLPGYLYGVVIAYAFIRRIEPPHEGRAGTLGAWWMLALAGIAWLTLGAIRIPGVQDTFHGAIIEAVLAAIVVAGIEGVVFGLMPLRFLPGELSFRWQRVNWALLYGLGLFGFVVIFLNPANGYLPPSGSVPFVVALVLFLGFGAASILFWGYFRFRPKRQTA